MIQNAIDRCREANQVIENNDFMKEVLYGFNESNKYFSIIEGRYNESVFIKCQCGALNTYEKGI